MKRLHFSNTAGAAYLRVPTRMAYLIPLFACATLASGCGPDNELGRLPFSGTVTLDGKPLDEGSISFVPVKPGEGTTRSGSTITDGQFQIDALKGLPPGEYLVKIHSAGDSPATPEDQAPGALAPPREELIPPKYNVNSEETITIKQDGENHFTFGIQTGG